MTLSTNVYILDPVDVQELFRYAQTVLTKYDEHHRTPDQQIWKDDERGWGEPGTRTIRNQLGQGLPAILDIDYRADGPLRTAEQAAQHDEDCAEDCSGEYHRRACWADLDFDTAYGYSHNGVGCGDLHAAMVAEVGRWLDERGIRWEWQNEFTSEVHGGDDRYERLVDLCRGGFEARSWFQNTVLPAVLSQAIKDAG